MKITVLGPAHPYRGGLASILEIMARTFLRRGDDVDIKTFTLQYPSLLFPGESQTVATPPPADLRIRRCVNTVNPLNWLSVGRTIRRERPDFVLLKYWTPFMAPCFGTIARLARGNGHTKVLCQIDNVEPHERHLSDRPFNRYFLSSVDGFIYMSEQVRRRSSRRIRCSRTSANGFPVPRRADGWGWTRRCATCFSSVSSATTRDWTCCSEHGRF